MSRSSIAVVLVLLVAGCTSTPSTTDGGGSEPASSVAGPTSAPSTSDRVSASAAPSGPGSITGLVTVNGEPRAGEEVELLPEAYVEPSPAMPPASGEPSGPTATTDASGRFTFADLEPGRYALMVTVLVEGAVSSDPFGMSWDEPCAVDRFQVLNVAVGEGGQPTGVMANATNQITDTNADQVVTITVGSGAQVTVDIPYVCTMGG
jgi:hypothetical protein